MILLCSESEHHFKLEHFDILISNGFYFDRSEPTTIGEALAIKYERICPACLHILVMSIHACGICSDIFIRTYS